VTFRCQDLRRELPEGAFDLVLCRNLAFTYFEPALQQETLARLLSRTRPGGALAIGLHESLPAGHALAPWPGIRCVYMHTVARADLLRGAELWNRGLYWEAHEAWEGPWRAAGRHSPAGRFFQGLILLAAAALKHERGAPTTARRLAARGARALAGAQAAPPPFDAPGFAAAVAAWLAGERPAPPHFDTFGPPRPLPPR
jgi:hypothetical protein